MKEWFKARNIWGAAIMALSDAEAGRLAKALWSYTMSGEQQNLSGAEKGVFALIQMTLSQDDIRESEISEKRSVAGASGVKQREAKKAIASIASEEEAKEAIECNKNKNKNKEKEEDIEKEIPLKGDKEKAQKRFSPPTIEEVAEYCRERGNNVNPQRFVNFYESKGWKVGNQPMKDWKASVRYWEQQDKENTGSNVRQMPTVPAQNYEQRSYSEQSESLEDLMRRLGSL